MPSTFLPKRHERGRSAAACRCANPPPPGGMNAAVGPGRTERNASVDGSLDGQARLQEDAQDCALPDALTEAHASAPISRLIAEVAAQCNGERITLGEMAEAFGDRAFGLLILLLCLPGLLPGMASRLRHADADPRHPDGPWLPQAEAARLPRAAVAQAHRPAAAGARLHHPHLARDRQGRALGAAASGPLHQRRRPTRWSAG